MKVLLTNDDGIFAPGMETLRRHAAGLGEVHVVAPAEQQSGASHSLNLYEPIQVREARRDGEFEETTPDEVNYMDVSPRQIVGAWSRILSPSSFFEHQRTLPAGSRQYRCMSSEPKYTRLLA